jgi:cobyric acid synthase
MDLLEKIKKSIASLPAKLKENKGIFTVEKIIAQRKAFLTSQKLVYIAKFRIVDDKKELKFTEMLKETGFGLSMGSISETSPGFGFKTESYNTLGVAREGTIQEQSNLFGKKYSYTFDFEEFRKELENLAKEAGLTFKYQITSIGL